MTEHVADCACIRCTIWRGADELIDAGAMGPWTFPSILTEIVAEIVASHPDQEERARRAEWFCQQLLASVERRAAEETDAVAEAKILPFGPIRPS